MSKAPVLTETYRGYRIWHRPWIKRRPYRCEVPRRVGERERGADWGTVEACQRFIDRGIKALERYPMCEDQPAQIDCRMASCQFHSRGECVNISPAITLNLGGRFACWSHVSRDADQETELRFDLLTTEECGALLRVVKASSWRGFHESGPFLQGLRKEIGGRKE